MSALSPKADSCGAATDVGYGPEADMCSAIANVHFSRPANIIDCVGVIVWFSLQISLKIIAASSQDGRNLRLEDHRRASHSSKQSRSARNAARAATPFSACLHPFLFLSRYPQPQEHPDDPGCAL